MKNKILDWARSRGILEKATPNAQFLKTVEEIGELADGLGKQDNIEIADAIGDITVTLVILAELQGLDFDECVQGAYEVIAKRSGKMINGIFVKDDNTNKDHNDLKEKEKEKDGRNL